jgi:hypothetical protein
MTLMTVPSSTNVAPTRYASRYLFTTGEPDRGSTEDVLSAALAASDAVTFGRRAWGMSRRLLKFSGGSVDGSYYATFSSAMTRPSC